MAEDDEIIARVLAGDREAFRALVERYEGPVYRFAAGLLGDHHAAEDAAQEAFLAAYRALAAFDAAKGRFSTWLFAIARNRCVSDLRRKGRGAAEDLGEDRPAPASDPPAAAEFRARLDRALEALPEGQRAAFALAAFAGLDAEAIAGIEGVEPVTIRSRLSRARAALRSALEAFAEANHERDRRL